jgi:hypothetical protein
MVSATTTTAGSRPSAAGAGRNGRAQPRAQAQASAEATGQAAARAAAGTRAQTEMKSQAGATTKAGAKTQATAAPGGTLVGSAERVAIGQPELGRVVADTLAALNQLERAATRIASPALASASEKLALAARTLQTGTASLGDALSELMRLQGQQTAQRSQDARSQLASNLTKQQAQTQRQLEQIAKRAEAAKKSKFWGKLVTVLKTVATAVTIAAGAITCNPLLIAGAALMIASMVTAMASKSEAAQWTSFGLALAGAALSAGVGAFGGAAGSASTATKVVTGAVAKGINLAKIILPASADAAAASFQVPKALAEGDGLEAEADLVELRGWAERVTKSSADERDTLGAVMQAQTRAVELIVNLLESHQRGAEGAVREGR